jgi:hypothetical protein
MLISSKLIKDQNRSRSSTQNYHINSTVSPFKVDLHDDLGKISRFFLNSVTF